MDGENGIEPRMQQLDLDVSETDEPKIKVENPEDESYGLHTQVCDTNEPEIKVENPEDESYGLHTHVCDTNEPEIKVENPENESYGLHTHVCDTNEPEIKVENREDESYGIHTHVCDTNEPQIKAENPEDESYGIHTHVCETNEPGIKVENSEEESYGIHTSVHFQNEQETGDGDEYPANQNVQLQHGIATFEPTGVKNESETEALLNPQSSHVNNVNVKVECEEEPEISSKESVEAKHSEVNEKGSSRKWRSRGACCAAVHCSFRQRKRSLLGADERRTDITMHRFPMKKPNLLGKWVAALCRSDGNDTDKQFRPTFATRICSQHFTNNDFTHGKYRKRLKPNAIPSVFNTVAPGKECCDVHETDGGCDTGDDESVPYFLTDSGSRMTSDVGVETGQFDSDGFQCRCCNLAFPTEELLEHHCVRLPHDEHWRQGRESCGVSSHSKGDKKLAIDVNSLVKGDGHRMAKGDDKDVNRIPTCDMARNVDTGDATANQDGHTCTVCSKAFGSRSKLTVHMRRHTNTIRRKRGGPFKCSVCSKSFARKSTLKQHIKIVHDRDKAYICSVCRRAFGQSCELQIHMRNIHAGEKVYKCLACFKAFGQNGSLQRHMTVVHNGEKAYICSVCDKAFGEKGHLKQHIKVVHNGEKRYKCTVCCKAFGRSSILHTHMKTVHFGEKAYKCTVCSKVFSANSHLKTHLRTIHYGEKTYKCTVCDKAFGLKSSLRRHMKTIHDANKPYKCTICHKAYGLNRQLQAHMRNLHDADKPYKCTVCRKAFRLSGNLQTHIRTVHNADSATRCPRAALISSLDAKYCWQTATTRRDTTGSASTFTGKY